MTVEANYIKRFLRIMERLPDSFKNESQIKKLLCNLRIDLIIPLHEKILKEFKEKAENTKKGVGPNIADVFIQIRVIIFTVKNDTFLFTFPHSCMHFKIVKMRECSLSRCDVKQCLMTGIQSGRGGLAV